MKKAKPAASVIIPVYNGAQTIEHAIASVRAQTISEWELIVVDDCSSDDTVEVVKGIIHRSADKRIHLVSRTHQSGVGGGRNTGVAASCAPFITFLDADDTLEPHALQELLKLTTHPSVDVAIAGITAHLPNGSVLSVSNKVNGTLTGLEATKALMRDRIPGFTHAKIYRRRLFTVVKNREGHLRNEDMVFNAAAFSYSRHVAVSHTSIYRYQVAVSSVTWTQISSLSFLDELRRAAREDMNPAVRALICQRTWSAFDMHFDLIAATTSSYAGISAELAEVLQERMRQNFRRRDIAAVAIKAPKIGFGNLVYTTAPTLYSMVCRALFRYWSRSPGAPLHAGLTTSPRSR